MKQIFTLFLSLTIFTSFAQTTADFENFNLQVDTFLNGDDLSGGFSSGNIFLPNNFNTDWLSWSGWSISSKTDSTTPGFGNQYSAITGGGETSGSYATAFVSGENIINLVGDAAGNHADGFYITNATYAYLSMQDGDQFSKKFGGVTGDDPDFFVLTIKGYYNGTLTTDSVDFYLADFRFSDNTQDYIIDDWTFVDLLPLGNVDSLSFTLNSSDVGMFGMNTPAYFCIDKFTTTDGVLSTQNVNAELAFDVYPNPASDFIILKNKDYNWDSFSIYNMNGQLIYNNVITNDNSPINIQELPKGNYVIRVKNKDYQSSKLFIKQ